MNKEEIKIKTYDEWLKYYENATKEDVIYDLTRDVVYFADAVGTIKDLQQENKRLKEEYMLLLNSSEQYEDRLQDRIINAVEYIKKALKHKTQLDLDAVLITIKEILGGDVDDE